MSTGGTITRAPTRLQTSIIEAVAVFEASRTVLLDAEYEVFADVCHRWLTRELVRLHLDEWRAAA